MNRNDIRKGIEELLATGFVVRTAHGLRQAGGGDPFRFALTWLPTGRGLQALPATNEWEVIARVLGFRGVLNVRSALQWLSGEVRPSPRSTGTLTAPPPPIRTLAG